MICGRFAQRRRVDLLRRAVLGVHFLRKNLTTWALSLIIAGLILLILAGLLFQFKAQAVFSIWKIQWLVGSGKLEELAKALDESMASVPAGEFWMGDNGGAPDERPMSRIYLDGFQIDRFEVTNLQYQRYLIASGENPPVYWDGIHYPTHQAAFPVVGVSWAQAQAYCAWQDKRLPSEAEWEKACQGSDGRNYAWGNAWSAGNANLGLSTAEYWPASLEGGWEILRSAPPDPRLPMLAATYRFGRDRSAFGVFNLTGNASEWTADWYTWEGYADVPVKNPLGGGPPWNHFVRGNAWFDRAGQAGNAPQFDRAGQAGNAPQFSRCAQRNSSHSHDDPRVGFRCAKDMP
jgi:formylglycine-generating enzyme required for sulfatase activity